MASNVKWVLSTNNRHKYLDGSIPIRDVASRYTINLTENG